MALLNREAKQFHRKLQRDYIDQLNENGIQICRDYFNCLGLFDDGTIQDPQDIREKLADENYPLEIFYRVAPTVDQDVMMTTLNPSMKREIGLSTFTEGEYHRHRKAGTDLEAKAETVALNLHGYLTRDDNSFDFVIDTLRKKLDIMDGTGSLENYLRCKEGNLLDGFFGEVCYTYPYKLATSEDDHIDKLPSLSREAARHSFAEELFEVVEPQILLCAGKQGWQTVWNYLDDPQDEIEAYSERSPVTKSYQRELGEGAFSGLYRIASEDLWILTTFHASRGVNRKRLERHAELLNDQLGS